MVRRATIDDVQTERVTLGWMMPLGPISSASSSINFVARLRIPIRFSPLRVKPMYFLTSFSSVKSTLLVHAERELGQ